MTDKYVKRSMDQAIRTVTEDISTDRVTNWCEHIRTRQVSVSPLGQSLKLPIGPKEVSCSEVDGSIQGMMYKGAAALFIRSNCVECPFHAPKNTNNIGQEIVDAAKAITSGNEADADALQDLADEGLDFERSQVADLQSDSQVGSLVRLLRDPERKAGAAAKLRQVARHFPDRISLVAGTAMTQSFSDPEVGDVLIETVLDLVHLHGDDLLAEAASAVRGMFVHVREKAKTIDAALVAGVLQPDFELSEELLMHLPPLVDTFEFRHGGRPDRSSVSQAYRRLAELDFETAAQVAGQALLDENHAHRRQMGASGVAELLLVDSERASVEFVRPLLVALGFLESALETDAALSVALAKCIAANPGPVSEAVFDVAPTLDQSTRASALTAFLRDEAMDMDETPWMSHLIGLVTNRSIEEDVRRRLVDRLQHAARRRPSKFWGYFDLLLGTLAQITDEAETARKRLDESAESVLEALEVQTNAILTSGSVLDFSKVVAWTAMENPEEAIAVIDDLLHKTDSRLAGFYKAALLRSLGELGRHAKTISPSLVPIIHPHLIDPVSRHVRAAALKACEDLVDWNRDVLPEDTILLAATLLGDEYLSPVAVAAVGVFRRARVADLLLATAVMKMLFRLYRSYGDNLDYGIVRDLSWAFSNLAAQHEPLEGPIARIFAEMSSHNDYYSAKDAVKTFGWFARVRGKYQPEYADVLIDFLGRFRLTTSLQGYSHIGGRTSTLFEDFFQLDPEMVRARAPRLVAFALDSDEDGNILHVAALLMTLGMRDEAADLFDKLADKLPGERRNEWRVNKYRGIAKALRAEEVLSHCDREFGGVIEAFRDARELMAEGRTPRRRLPFNLGDVESEPPFYERWLDLRLRWIQLPDVAADWEAATSELVEFATSLSEHDLADRDQAIVHTAAMLCTAAARVSEWWTLVRSANPMSSAARDAALACLADAAEATELVEGPEGSARVSLILNAVKALTPGAGQSGMKDVIAKIRAFPLQVPCYNLPVPQEWRPKSRRNDELDRRQQGPNEQPVIAVASITINGEEPPPVFEAISQRTYDVEVTIDVANAPAGSKQLQLRPVSSLRDDDYRFPQGTLVLPQPKKVVTHRGTMLFLYPQSEGSQPTSVKMLATLLISDGTSTNVELFGRHELSIRVNRDVERYRARGPAAPQAVQKLREELESLVASERDPNRRDEIEVLEAVVDFMERQLRTASLRGTTSERSFESQMKNDLDIRFEGRDDVYSQVKTGAGFVDCLVLGVPVELKVFSQGNLDEFIDASLPQATQYVVTQSRRVGFLVILDCGQRAEATPALVDDVQFRQGLTGKGLDPVPDGVIAVGVMVVRAHSTIPSRLRPPPDSGR